MRLTSFFCIAFFALLFVPFCSAVLVSVRPADRTSLEVYSFEVTAFEVVAVNDSFSEIKNFDVLLSSSPDLIFVIDGFEEKQQRITFVSIGPNETKTKQFFVKGISLSQKTAFLKAEFGEIGLKESYSSPVLIQKSPLEFNARLLKTALEPFEENSVIFDLKNDGQGTVSDITVSVELPPGFSMPIDSFSVDAIAFGQSILNSKIGFSAGPQALGEQPVIVRASFQDGTGFHQQQKTFVVDVRERANYLYLLLGLVLVVGALMFFFSKKRVSGQVQQKPLVEKH